MKVQSSTISEIDYQDNILTVTFNNGRVYTYEGVSRELFERLANSESKGKFFHENINYRFNFKRIK